MPEEEAFCVFVKLMQDYRLRELFKPSMAELGLCMYQFECMIQVQTSHHTYTAHLKLQTGTLKIWQRCSNFLPYRSNSQSCTCISRLRAFTPPCMPPPGSSPSSSPPSLWLSPRGSSISSCVRSVKREWSCSHLLWMISCIYPKVSVYRKCVCLHICHSI